MKAFLSSTFIDLQAHRERAFDALDRLGLRVLRMESFGARPEEPTAACLTEVRECDIFVGVYAHRYGSILSGHEYSIVEEEYIEAKRLKKPSFCFILDPNHPWPPRLVDESCSKKRLDRLLANIKNKDVYSDFNSPEDLAFRVATSVGRYLSDPSVQTEKVTIETLEAQMRRAGNGNNGRNRYTIWFFSALVLVNPEYVPRLSLVAYKSTAKLIGGPESETRTFAFDIIEGGAAAVRPDYIHILAAGPRHGPPIVIQEPSHIRVVAAFEMQATSFDPTTTPKVVMCLRAAEKAARVPDMSVKLTPSDQEKRDDWILDLSD